ncbi:MAG: hypothetical protein ABIH63_00710 [archaeon]
MKRAQAAMEFLMTYGWAILVVLVAIGALAYFGVLNPSRFLPSSCTLIPGLGCDEHKATSAGATLIIRNGMGSDVTVNSITFATQTGVVDGCTPDSGTITDGGTDTFTIGCTTFPSSGRVKADISMNYTVSGSTLSHTATGSLVTRIE